MSDPVNVPICRNPRRLILRTKSAFGTHQLREKVDEDNLIYVTWFAGGLRIIDINDPANPKEQGYFIPKPGDGVAASLRTSRNYYSWCSAASSIRAI